MNATRQTPAIDLANQNGVRFPNERGRYREARDALLAEEIELRRHIERVAEQRRALPPGGTVPMDYAFVGVDARGWEEAVREVGLGRRARADRRAALVQQI